MTLTPNGAEQARLQTHFPGREGWKAWGPYLSERQWGTVREDYSPHGNAWDYFPHDHARSRAYRWGEDGIAGFSDREQRLCLAVALWNERDPILKERLFGLTNGEGNHGEDVKELYYYLDATPTHSYLKMLYKYPQAEYPYTRLIEENRRRGSGQPEFELIDSGLFDSDRYFDVFVEYAQAEPGDLLLRITVENRGPEAAPIHVLPQLWFRNTWSWKAGARRPVLQQVAPGLVRAEHPSLGVFYLHADGDPTELLFCENESNGQRLWNEPPQPGYFKDGIHERVVHGDVTAVNPARLGTKAAAWYSRQVPAGGRTQFRLCLRRRARSEAFRDFDALFSLRLQEADEFYAQLQDGMHCADARLVQRQAFAGMIWSKQLFYFDVAEWLRGDPAQPPPPPARRHGRNCEWEHLNNADIISMRSLPRSNSCC